MPGDWLEENKFQKPNFEGFYYQCQPASVPASKSSSEREKGSQLQYFKDVNDSQLSSMEY